jgi:hypothetical protein
MKLESLQNILLPYKNVMKLESLQNILLPYKNTYINL